MGALSDARAILRAGVAAVDPARAVRGALRSRGRRLWVGRRSWQLGSTGTVRVVAIGKAASGMADAAARAWGRRIAEGFVVLPEGHPPPRARFEVREAGHPVPDRESEAAARRALDFVRASESSDAVLFLVSGGGSSVLEAPAEGISLEALQEATRILLASGAPIQDLNVVRRHISTVKGGRLAAATRAGVFATLAISDVVGDAPWDIASGPTAADPTTYSDALVVVDRHSLANRLPAAVVGHLRAGARGRVSETAKPSESFWRRGSYELVATNRVALEAARRAARARAYRCAVLSAAVTGETRDVAAVHAALLAKITRLGRPFRRPACVLSGGETTVRLGPGAMKGGRNQEFALAAASAIDGIPRVAVLSIGTDGVDGPTDAAGGWVDGATVRRARRRGVDLERALAEHDTYAALDRLGQLLRTGPTGTNVMDLHALVAAAGPPRSRRTPSQPGLRPR